MPVNNKNEIPVSSGSEFENIVDENDEQNKNNKGYYIHNCRRIRGFECPLHCSQVLVSIVITILVTTMLFLCFTKLLQKRNYQMISITACYTFLSIVGIGLWIYCSVRDPCHPILQEKEKHIYEELVGDSSERKPLLSKDNEGLSSYEAEFYGDIQDDVIFYCELCEIHVESGTKHCGYCRKCVRAFDHHCKFMNTCVGGSTYMAFFILSVCFWLSSLIQTVFGFLLLYTTWLGSYENTKMDVILVYIGSVLGFFVCIAFGSLSFFHMYLMYRNLSTYDFLIQRRNA